MGKAMTGAIFLEIPGDKDQEMTSGADLGPGHGESGGSSQNGEAACGWDRRIQGQGRAAECFGVGRGMRRCRGAGRED
jgi:hypothetical protein